MQACSTGAEQLSAYNLGMLGAWRGAWRPKSASGRSWVKRRRPKKGPLGKASARRVAPAHRRKPKLAVVHFRAGWACALRCVMASAPSASWAHLAPSPAPAVTLAASVSLAVAAPRAR
jgi:hypothetical protein